MRQSEKISLPTFYARQYETKHSTSEEILIFRWFQYLEQHRHLYAVKNKHQCFDNNNATTSIVQPFASVDYFFGCLECGKYHLCRSKRDTCEVSIDSRDNQQICRYSGRPLLEQDNLALTFEDTTHFDHEAIQFSTTDTRKTLSRIETHARQKKRKRNSNGADPLVKRRHLIELFKEARDDGSALTNQHRKKRSRINHLEHMATLFDTGDVYELSIDSLDDDDDDGDDEKREPNIKDGDHDDDDDDDDEEEVVKNGHDKEDDDEEEEEVVMKKAYCDGMGDEEGASCVRLGQRDEDGDDEGEWGGAALIDDINGDGRHTKNYHNNIKYRNDYYGFLFGTLAKQKQTRHNDGEQRSSLVKKNDFFEMCNRDIREETPSIETMATTTTTVDTTHQIKMSSSSSLSPGICTEIENETRNILTLLIGVNGPYVKKKDSLALLLEKFVPLIENIVLLVYHSPVINRQTLIRDIKNHNQSHNFSLSSSDITNSGGDDNNNNTNESMRSEQIISPQKMCRTLLLHTLTEAFSLHDDYEHRIGVWQPDPWLRRFNCKKTNRVLIRDFFSSHTKRDTLCSGGGGGGDLSTFRKEIMDTSTLIRESLEFYTLCPLWLRYRVFKIRDK